MTAAANVIFAVGFIFYFWFSGLLPEGQRVYYALPFLAYFFLGIFSALSSYVSGDKFKKLFLSHSVSLFAFVILFMAPAAVKTAFPEPHNFTERKLELVLGVSYAVFIIINTVITLKAVLKNEKGYKNPAVIFALLFTVFAGASVWMNHANRPAGDEPIYLLTSHSLIYDFDLDLKNNYENRDYSRFYKGELVPQEKETGGKLISFHPVMISFLMTPFYLAGGRAGAVLFINLLAALAGALIWMILVKSGHDEKTASIAAFITCFSMPFFPFINQTAADMPSAFFLAASYYFIRYKKEKTGFMSLSALIFLWLHPRNAVIWCVLCAISAYEYRKEIKKLAVFASLQSAGLVLFFLYNRLIFGSFMPPAMQDPVSSYSEIFSFNLKGMAGILFDQEFGLFFYTPVFMLMFAGFILMYKRDKKTFIYNTLIFVPLFILVTSWLDWRGGGGASPRFFVPVIFILAALTAEIIRSLNNAGAKKVFFTLAIAGAAVSAVVFFIPWFRWNKGFGENWLLKFIPQAGGFKASMLFPSVWASAAGWQIKTALWAGVVALLNAYFLKRDQPKN